MLNTKLVVKGMIVLGMILCGCAIPPAQTQTPMPVPPTSTPTRSREGPITIAFVPGGMGIPYFDTANQGAQEAAAELGIEVMYTGPATADATEQIQLLNALIAQGVDGLAVYANHADALVPVGQDAMNQGIPVVSWHLAIGPEGRIIHVGPPNMEGLARVQLEMASRLADGEGQIAILYIVRAAGPLNISEVLRWMLEEDEAYKGLELVDESSHNSSEDEDEMLYNNALDLLVDYPDLEVIVAPTTVGIAAAARAVQDRGKIGQVFVTGLGTPNQMREYVKSGASPEFALWNPIDLGYLTIYATYHLVTGDITGEPGDEFEAGRLGSYLVVNEGGYMEGDVVLGPYIFDADNIDDFDF